MKDNGLLEFGDYSSSIDIEQAKNKKPFINWKAIGNCIEKCIDYIENLIERCWKAICQSIGNCIEKHADFIIIAIQFWLIFG